MKNNYRPKEISWLSFNERVLLEANNPKVPIYERLKFLAIYSSNLDEFYRVRVATLKRLAKLGDRGFEVIGHNPQKTLEKISQIIKEQNVLYEKTRKNIKQELKNKKIEFVNEKNLSKEQKKYVFEYFKNKVQSSLMPIMLKQGSKIPDLADNTMYFAIRIFNAKKDETNYSIVQLPTNKLDRFIILPKTKDITYVMYIDDIIRLGLSELFYFMPHTQIEAFAFKLTKDAELDIKDDISTTYLELVDAGLKQRKKGNAVRFIHDKSMDKELLNYLKKLLKIKSYDTTTAGTRYHNTKDFIKFPNIFDKKDQYEAYPQIPIPVLDKQKSFFNTLKKQDVMLHYPYHSFNYFINFLKEASVDANVSSIKVTLYRLSGKSDIVSTLINAVKNGKKVTAVLELRARFDENANIKWSRVLAENGIRVIHGVPGLKVHSKLSLITRKENGKTKFYAAIGTGNYNESTAKLYTDITLLTANPRITRDVAKVFSFLRQNFRQYRYNHLLVSPFTFRRNLRRLIHREIGNAQKGLPAYIHIKINNIEDREIVNLLYEASQKGVEVILLVRGMFSLIAGIEGVSDKIVARGIIDRFLEHNRILIFCNNNKPEAFLASADLMRRNIDRRVEVTTPVYDPKLVQELIDIFNIHLADNEKSFILDKDLKNKYFRNNKPAYNAQYEMHKYLKNK